MRSPPAEHIRDGIVDWVNGLDWNKSITITLTFPHAIAAGREATIHNAQYFWNVVDQRVYGKRSKNRKRAFRCQRVMFLEDGAYGWNHHYHGVVSVPVNPYAKRKYKTLKGMKGLLKDTWEEKMAFNSKRKSKLPAKIVPLRTSALLDSNWVKYMTKKIKHADHSDILCLETTCVVDGRQPC
jgi:hypothetical protein